MIPEKLLHRSLPSGTLKGARYYHMVKFDYFKMESGTTILTWGVFPHQGRRSFRDIDLAKLDALVDSFDLSAFAKVKLLIKLQRFKNVYDMDKSFSTVSADTAVARWIGEILESINRIRNASSLDQLKFAEALQAMATQGDKWARAELANEKTEADLGDLGFDIYRADRFVSYGSHQFIKQWFANADLIEKFAKKAKQQLIEDARPRNRLTGDYSKEALLYGKKLPRLYTQITKRKFGISKIGGAVAKTTGVAFVINCAEIIGLTPVSPANVASHWRNIGKMSVG